MAAADVKIPAYMYQKIWNMLNEANELERFIAFPTLDDIIFLIKDLLGINEKFIVNSGISELYLVASKGRLHKNYFLGVRLVHPLEHIKGGFLPIEDIEWDVENFKRGNVAVIEIESPDYRLTNLESILVTRESFVEKSIHLVQGTQFENLQELRVYRVRKK